MKSLTVIALLLVIPICLAAQAQDIQVFEKKDGNKITVVARNIGQVDYAVTVDIQSAGMNVTPGKNVSAVIPAGHMKDMAILEPIPGQGWSYGYDVSFTQSSGGTGSGGQVNEAQPASSPAAARPASAPSPALSNAPLILYTQATCGRCTMAKKELSGRNLKFEEVDVNSGSPEVNAMWMKLRENGFTGTTVTMPVIRYNGIYHYDIKDLKEFLSTLK